MSEPFRAGLISPYSNVSAMGLRSISASLIAAGFDTRLVFLPDLDELLYIPRDPPQGYPDDILDQVCQVCADVDLVGISVMSQFVARARDLTRAIHDRLSVPVIWGGIHPTVRPAECLTWADWVCVGEGEEAMVELTDRLAAGHDPHDIPNIWSKDSGGKIRATPVRPLNRVLDSLPLPDYDLSRQFILQAGQVVRLTPDLLAYHLLNAFAGDVRVAYMICAGRGCPYSCTYCGNNALAGIYPDWRRVRWRSPENIVREIQASRKIIPSLEAVMFVDSTFLARSTQAIAAFAATYREQVNLPFFILATPESVTEEKLRLLVAAGLQDVEMGIQTGSTRVQAVFGRPPGSHRILQAAQCLNRFRAHIPRPRYDLITDNPYETDVDRLQTLHLLSQLPRPYLLYILSLTFYPGTELYRRTKSCGLIPDDEQAIYRKNYLKIAPTYYNFVLWCLHRGVARPVLRVMIQPRVFCVLSSPAAQSIFSLFWKILVGWRNRRARQIRSRWLSRLASHAEQGG